MTRPRNTVPWRQLLVLRAPVGALVLLCGCAPTLPEPSPEQRLILAGRELFFNETFAGNGRTCGSCHRAEANFAIDAAFIATLPDDDPLFIAERSPELRENFENPRLMREFGLILENLDGFSDLASVFVQRGVPHTLGLNASIESPAGPRTGWSGDGAPRDGSLRAFAIGAVIQHFTRTLNRVPGVDFRLPTEDELAALEAFQLALGRQADLELPLALKSAFAQRGQGIFLDDSLGKCNLCHGNAGANATRNGAAAGNLNFNTGVEDLVDQRIDGIGERVPRDDGFGAPGDGTFNTPPLVEAADTAPFFHNNSVETIEGAVAFYNSEAFANSPAGGFLASTDPNGVAISLEVTQVEAVAAFLRVINALENIRAAVDLIQGSLGESFALYGAVDEQLRIAGFEIQDAVVVLEGASIDADAVAHLESAAALARQAAGSAFGKRSYAQRALAALAMARAELVEQ